MLGCVISPAAVVPSTTTDDTAHSSTFPVPRYNTLTVEVWGPGMGGYSYNEADTGNFLNQGNGGVTTASSVSTLGMTANGGGNGTNNNLGGTASGGNTTNTTGTNGGNGGSSTVPVNGGLGGGSPNGGASSTGPASPSPSSGTPQTVAGNAGNAPGGGGSAPAGSKTNFSGANDYSGGIGGAGGGYTKSIYTFGVTSGFPAVGSVLSYTVSPGTASGGGTSGIPSSRGGAGTNGRVKFTVA